MYPCINFARVLDMQGDGAQMEPAGDLHTCEELLCIFMHASLSVYIYVCTHIHIHAHTTSEIFHAAYRLARA